MINKTEVFSTQNQDQGEQLSKLAVLGMQEKKGRQIAVLDLRTIKNAIADFFIICSGNSDTQVDAITDSVEDMIIKHTGQRASHKEGRLNREWILLDYTDVIVHIFRKDKREFYKLEELWGDGQINYIEDLD